jgi:hypothetical protein
MSTTMVVIAVVAALALLGVVVVTVVIISQEAEARSCVTGFAASGNKSALFTAFENSKGRCFFH